MVVGTRIPSTTWPPSLFTLCPQQKLSVLVSECQSPLSCGWSLDKKLATKGGWHSFQKMASTLLSTMMFSGDMGRGTFHNDGVAYNSARRRRQFMNCECLKDSQPGCLPSTQSLSRAPLPRQGKMERALELEVDSDKSSNKSPERGLLDLSLAAISDVGFAPTLAGAILILSCGLFSPRAALAEKRWQAPVIATASVSPREESPGAQIQVGEKRDPEPFPKIARFQLSKQLDDPKDDQTAIALKRYLESNPGDRNALKSLLHLRMTKGDVNSSIEVLDQLVKAEPDVIEWKYIRAQALEFSGNFDAAREGFEQILTEDPYSARALQGLATVMQKTGEDSLVLEMLEGAVQKAIGAEKKKEATNLKMLLGQVHMTQGNMEEALRQYKEISDEDPKDFRPHLCQGLVYSIIGQLDEADSHFKQFRALCPPNFPNRGYLDDMMLRAKTEARRLEEKKKQDAVLKQRGRQPKKPLQQPKAGGPPREED